VLCCSSRWCWTVFSNGAYITQESSAIFLLAGNYKERAIAAATLYNDGYAPLIVLTNDGVFSRWSKKEHRNLYNIEWAEEELVGLGVPRNAIKKLSFYKNGTYYDALATKEYVFKMDFKNVILVTSDYHTRRSLWTFQHVLRKYPVEIYVFPAKATLVGKKDIALEYAKLVYYRIRFGSME